MNNNRTVSELKASARAHMFGNYRPAIGAYLWMNLILTAIMMIFSSALPDNTFGKLLNYIIYALSLLIMAIFESGRCFMYLNIACGNPVSADMIFYGFKNNPDKAIVLELNIMIREILLAIPCAIAISLYTYEQNIIMIILIVATLVLFIVGATYVILLYFPVFFLMHDFPNMTAKEIIDYSQKIMKGNMKRLLGLYISFIPIKLLSLITFGIGDLWVDPYLCSSSTEFFMDIMKNTQANN